jgi:hypothetical protein
MNTYGEQENEICNRKECKGIIQLHPIENCSCHINPPCSSCTTPKAYCPDCGWESKNDQIINDFIVNTDPLTGNYNSHYLRKLDNTKIDYYILNHTHFSQLIRGVYPEGTSQADILNLVNGSFGGRFTKFENGKFEFIAYTD